VGRQPGGRVERHVEQNSRGRVGEVLAADAALHGRVVAILLVVAAQDIHLRFAVAGGRGQLRRIGREPRAVEPVGRGRGLRQGGEGRGQGKGS
nr:hypothetical protein [Tanacetum cinerariifolium]